jgi:predicted outer membrane repeat protein
MTITLASKLLILGKVLTINGDVNLNGKPDDVYIRYSPPPSVFFFLFCPLPVPHLLFLFLFLLLLLLLHSGNFVTTIFQTSTTLKLFGLTITKGGSAGAVKATNTGVLNATRCTFTHNHAGDNGGAISTDGGSTLAIVESYFYNNSAVTLGGAIRVGGSGTIYRSLFYANKAGYGGAVSIGSSTVTVTDSTFSRNWAGECLYLCLLLLLLFLFFSCSFPFSFS